MTEGHEVVSCKGAVAAGPAEAARIGARILEQGGNAMDAGAAACLACCMIQPQSTGVAGYVCAGVVLEGRTGRVWSLDSNSIAPAGLSPELFEVSPAPEGGPSLNEREYFCRVKDDANVHGPLAVGVPGMMAGMGILHERWGRLKWPAIVAPSQRLLENGYRCECAGAVKSLEPVIRRFEPTLNHLMPHGRLPTPDDVWHRPEMQKTLARIAQEGWRDMYSGELGRKIAGYIQSIGGVLSCRDMAEFEPRMAHCVLEFGATAKAAAFAPRLYVGEAEPLEVHETAGPEIVDGLRAMGHEVTVVKHIAGGAHLAEHLKSERKVRAGGNTWAAGAE